MIYLYAIGEREARVDEPGFDERPVEAVRHGRLSAYVSRDVTADVAPTPANLLRHDGVVAAAMRSGAVLPMRFGTLVRYEDDLHAVLDEREEALARRLERVRGRVELGARALWRRDREPAAAADSGREFLQAKLRRREAAREAAQALHRPLAELAADASCTLLPRDDTAFSAAYLVDRTRAPELEDRAAALRTASEDVELVVSGPWPPYSFSEGPDA